MSLVQGQRGEREENRIDKEKAGDKVQEQEGGGAMETNKERERPGAAS